MEYSRYFLQGFALLLPVLLRILADSLHCDKVNLHPRSTPYKTVLYSDHGFVLRGPTRGLRIGLRLESFRSFVGEVSLFFGSISTSTQLINKSFIGGAG